MDNAIATCRGRPRCALAAALAVALVACGPSYKRRVVESGSKVEIMEAGRHDRVLAITSHLPHLIAFALMNAIHEQKQGQEFLSLAGPGFRDFTRYRPHFSPDQQLPDQVDGEHDQQHQHNPN